MRKLCLYSKKYRAKGLTLMRVRIIDFLLLMKVGLGARWGVLALWERIILTRIWLPLIEIKESLSLTSRVEMTQFFRLQVHLQLHADRKWNYNHLRIWTIVKGSVKIRYQISRRRRKRKRRRSAMSQIGSSGRFWRCRLVCMWTTFWGCLCRSKLSSRTIWTLHP